jgi:hypothetical protein
VRRLQYRAHDAKSPSARSVQPTARVRAVDSTRPPPDVCSIAREVGIRPGPYDARVAEDTFDAPSDRSGRKTGYVGALQDGTEKRERDSVRPCRLPQSGRVMSVHPVAFVDEAFIRLNRHPGAYLFAAVLVDADNLTDVIDAARQAAGPHDDFHASDLYRRGHIQPIEDMLDTTEAHAGWTLMIAQTPLGEHQEAARQAALAQLLHQLNEQKVRDVVLDTRASPREQLDNQLQGRKISRSDLPDITTYRRLVRSQQINARMRLQHVDDRRQPALWLADVTAWAFQRALVFDEPQWWSRVAGVATIHDAATGVELTLTSDRTAPPTGERGPQIQSPSAQNSLSSTTFYTLNGGTTNRTQGPGYLYNALLSQSIDARTRPPSSALGASLAELTASVSRLATAIEATDESRGQPDHSYPARIDVGGRDTIEAAGAHQSEFEAQEPGVG